MKHIEQILIKEWQSGICLYQIYRIQFPPEVVKQMSAYDFMLSTEWHCGYCTLPVQLNREQRNMVDVHGGITSFEDNEDGTFTYGFDTNRAEDREDPKNTLAWLEQECQRMAQNIQMIAQNDK